MQPSAFDEVQFFRAVHHSGETMIPAAIERAINAPATASEMRQALEQPIDADQRQEVLSLVRWFTRRYPPPADRLAYVRQAYTRWRPPHAGRA